MVRACGWLSQLSTQLQLRSWSRGSWVQALHQALCCQHRACFRSSVPLSLPLPYPCTHTLSLSKINPRKGSRISGVLKPSREPNGRHRRTVTRCLLAALPILWRLPEYHGVRHPVRGEETGVTPFFPATPTQWDFRKQHSAPRWRWDRLTPNPALPGLVTAYLLEWHWLTQHSRPLLQTSTATTPQEPTDDSFFFFLPSFFFFRNQAHSFWFGLCQFSLYTYIYIFFYPILSPCFLFLLYFSFSFSGISPIVIWFSFVFFPPLSFFSFYAIRLHTHIPFFFFFFFYSRVTSTNKSKHT